MSVEVQMPVGTHHHALVNALADAERIYRRTEHFKIEIALLDDGWHVDFDIKDPLVCGGGPHYVIDAVSGEITWKRYDQ